MVDKHTKNSIVWIHYPLLIKFDPIQTREVNTNCKELVTPRDLVNLIWVWSTRDLLSDTDNHYV